MALMTILGCVGTAVAMLLAPWFVERMLKIPPELQRETLRAFWLLAISLPFVISTSGLRGLLEAYSRFDLSNVVRVPLGVLTYLAPLVTLRFSTSLPAMVSALVITRVLSWATYLVLCATSYPALRKRRSLAPHLLRRLLSFSGWMTVSNIVGPLLLYLGRIMIAVLISAEGVAYFSTPYDVVINLLLVPTILVGVLFPAFSQLFRSDHERAVRIYRRAMKYIGVVMLPLAAITFVVAKPALSLWINPDFAAHGYRVAQLLAIGVFINSFGHLAQALIQGYGRPDVTAKLHVIELILYVSYSWLLIKRYGINGAAMAWVIRVTISTVVLQFLAAKCLNGSLAARA
jgi:O-antigen/teichoic acid export membrane protein